MNDSEKIIQVRFLDDTMKVFQVGPVRLSEIINVPYSTFRDWKSGKSKMPMIAKRYIQLLLSHPSLLAKRKREAEKA